MPYRTQGQLVLEIRQEKLMLVPLMFREQIICRIPGRSRQLGPPHTLAQRQIIRKLDLVITPHQRFNLR